MKMPKISVWVALAFVGSAGVFAWLFLRGETRVTHTVGIEEDGVIIRYL